jgi:hypothetical protein
MTQEEDNNGTLRALRSWTNIISDGLKDEEFRGSKLQTWERRTLFQGVSLLTDFNVMVVGYHKRLQLSSVSNLELLGWSLIMTVSFTKAVRVAYHSSQ